MLNESRRLWLSADGTSIAEDRRIRVQGRSNMTLLPDFFQVEVYNMSAEEKAVLNRAKHIAVYVEDGSRICSGDIDGIYVYSTGSYEIMTISLSDGMAFWTSTVDTSIGAGAWARDAILTILSGATFGDFLCENVRALRGQTFSGRVADAIHYIAKSLNARAFVVGNVLSVIGKGNDLNVTKLKQEDVLLNPGTSDGIKILKTIVRGYSVGHIVEFENQRYRIIVQAINIDNFQGNWETEITLVEDRQFFLSEMGGGW